MIIMVIGASAAGSREADDAGLELLRRIGQKDRVAFRAFYDRYAPKIGGFLSKTLKDPAWVDEAVNDVMMVVWEAGGTFDPSRSRLTTWLFGIAHNKGLTILERMQRHWREQTLDDELPESSQDEAVDDIGNPERSDSSDPERTVLGWELGEILSWALDRLTPEHRIVLELLFVEGYTYKEIAEITECPINTVKTRIFHARKKLGEFLERRGYPLAVIHEGIRT
jgi:RNA polymerase sigma-70 factor (ECF subfamily)